MGSARSPTKPTKPAPLSNRGMTHRFRIQALIGGEEVLPTPRHFQIDRAHLRIQRLAHFADHQPQRFGKVPRPAYVLNDLLQKAEHLAVRVLG